jgi:hypothetical protein
VNRTLLMANEDMANGVLLEQRVIHRKYGAAGITEDDLNTLIRQGLDHHFRTRHTIARHNAYTFHFRSVRPVTTPGRHFPLLHCIKDSRDKRIASR